MKKNVRPFYSLQQFEYVFHIEFICNFSIFTLLQNDLENSHWGAQPTNFTKDVYIIKNVQYFGPMKQITQGLKNILWTNNEDKINYPVSVSCSRHFLLK